MSSFCHSAISLQFLINLSFISTPLLLLPAMCPSPQFAHLYSFGHLFVSSLVWSSSPQLSQTRFRLHLVFVCPYTYVAVMNYHEPVLVVVYSGIRWFSMDVDSILLLL